MKGSRWQRLDLNWILVLVLAAAATYIWVQLLTSNLFVFTEARDMIGWHQWPGDLARWLLFPEPIWGPGRLTGMASYQLTGLVCGTNLACISGVGAAMLGVATALLLVHTRQVTRSKAIAVGVAILWVLSPAVLGISIWQSARFDTLAFSGVLAAGILWWSVFSRPTVTPAWAVATVVGSILVMAFTFNAKEVTYFLVGMMPALAVIRGAGRPGAVRRNLALCVVPVAYGVWFIAHALTHIQEAYAASSGGSPSFDIATRLLTQLFGLHRGFMFVGQEGSTYELLSGVALAGFWVFVLAVAVAFGVSAYHGLLWRPMARLRARRWGHLVGQAGPWLYVATVIPIIIVLSSRSRGAETYYLTLAYWAFLSLAGMTLRWLVGYLPRRRAWLTTLVVLFVIPSLAAYASLLTERSTYGRLIADSDRMADTSSILRNALDERTVTSVSWRMVDELGPTAFFVLRGDSATYQPDDDIWPWLMHDRTARPEVAALVDGTLEELRAATADNATEGEVLVIMDRDYELLLVAHQGDVLWDPRSDR
jgi:hypothetical protein